jgi:hypothetical protein
LGTSHKQSRRLVSLRLIDTEIAEKGRFRTETRIHLKNVDQGSGQGAGRRKSAAYTEVCEHFEPTRNAAMGT